MKMYNIAIALIVLCGNLYTPPHLIAFEEHTDDQHTLNYLLSNATSSNDLNSENFGE